MEMTLREVPGSKTQFVCFPKFRHVRYTGHKSLRIFALPLTEVPNPERLLSFQ